MQADMAPAAAIAANALKPNLQYPSRAAQAAANFAPNSANMNHPRSVD
jgi:hypothetical protein